ncbi:MAG: polysaccharide pyruvyl transferase CsaB [Bacillota bacterium]|nr:polysaccharide pyruvyl transferase CsaB [Bacillota bacterium]
MDRVVIAGYYGYDNAGDEAIAEAVVYAFRTLAPDVHLTVLSGQPARTRARLGVDTVDRFSPPALLGALARCHLLVFGGGSLLQDVTSFRSLLYYQAVFALALALGKPVVVYANGLGPIRSRLGRTVTAALLRRARLVSLRDRHSWQEALRLGARAPLLTADPAFLLSPTPEGDLSRTLKAEGWDSLPRPRVGVAPRSWPASPGFVTEMGASLDRLAAEGASVVFIPMQHPQDTAAIEEIRAAMEEPARVLAARYGPRELLGLMGHLDLVIGMRLHALVFAAAAGVPVVGISYDPKVDSFLAELGCPQAGTPSDLHGDRLVETSRRVLADGDLHRHVQEKTVSFRNLAWENARATVALLPHHSG